LAKIIDDSPGYIEAAAALVAVGGEVPEKTVQALWSDGAGLLELTAQVRRAAAPPALVTPWVDRAVQLGAAEAHFVRAGFRLEQASPEALLRLARVAERAPDARALAELQRAAAQGIAPAWWALARIDLQRGRADDALPRIERFLATAAPDDPGIADARAARDDLLRTTTAAAQARLRQRAAIALGAAALLLVLVAWLWAGAPLESALRKAPRLFPP